jgi:putative oxidoreductase
MLTDLGLLLIRLTLGPLFFGHGAQKLFGWFGGAGPAGTARTMASLGLRPPRFWAIVAGVVELVGGTLFGLGLLNPLGSLCITASMLTAIARVHWPRFWVQEGGIEYPLVNAVVVNAVALAEGGRYSLDRLLRLRLPVPASLLLGLGLVAGAVRVLHVANPPRATRAEAVGGQPREARAG